MSEFTFGFVSGVMSLLVVSALLVALMMVFISAGKREYDEEPEEQPDIRLTTIKSEHIRSIGQ
jgi:hypothetical protein